MGSSTALAVAGAGLPGEMVKAQETRRLPANSRGATGASGPIPEPREPGGALSPPPECEPTGKGDPGPRTMWFLFSHPRGGPGYWSHTGPGGQGCWLPHIQRDPRLHKMGWGGCSPKGLPSLEFPVPVPIRMEAHGDFWSQNTPALQPGHCVTQGPSLTARLLQRGHRRGRRIF